MLKDSWVANFQIVAAITSHEKESCSSEKCMLPSLGQEMSKKSLGDLGPTNEEAVKGHRSYAKWTQKPIRINSWQYESI